MTDDRPVILVNGLPAAGKSTLAPALARVLRLPLISKDVIKETHADMLGSEPPPDRTQREWSRSLGAAAGQTQWALLAHATGGAVLESSWRADVRQQVVAGLASAGVSTVAEIWCEVPPELLRRRYRERQPTRHPIHGAPTDDADWDQIDSYAQPLALGPVYRLDTSGPVDLGAVAQWCRHALNSR